MRTTRPRTICQNYFWYFCIIIGFVSLTRPTKFVALPEMIKKCGIFLIITFSYQFSVISFFSLNIPPNYRKSNLHLTISSFSAYLNTLVLWHFSCLSSFYQTLLTVLLMNDMTQCVSIVLEQVAGRIHCSRNHRHLYFVRYPNQFSVMSQFLFP